MKTTTRVPRRIFACLILISLRAAAQPNLSVDEAAREIHFVSARILKGSGQNTEWKLHVWREGRGVTTHAWDHSAAVSSPRRSADGSVLAYSIKDSLIVERNGEKVLELRGLYAQGVSPRGRFARIQSGILDLNSGAVRAYGDTPMFLGFSSDERAIERNAGVFYVDPVTLARTPAPFPGGAQAVDPRGRWALLSGALWRPDGTHTPFPLWDGPIVSPNGEWLTGWCSGSRCAARVRDGETFPIPWDWDSVEFSGSGAWLAGIGFHGELFRVDLETRVVETVVQASPSPFGQRLTGVPGSAIAIPENVRVRNLSLSIGPHTLPVRDGRAILPFDLPPRSAFYRMFNPEAPFETFGSIDLPALGIAQAGNDLGPAVTLGDGTPLLHAPRATPLATAKEGDVVSAYFTGFGPVDSEGHPRVLLGPCFTYQYHSFNTVVGGVSPSECSQPVYVPSGGVYRVDARIPVREWIRKPGEDQVTLVFDFGTVPELPRVGVRFSVPVRP